MIRKFGILLLFLLALSTVSCSTSKLLCHNNKDLSPYDFGLATAKTGVDRYFVLLETHRAAIAAGVNVDYSGIDTVKLEMPAKPVGIPLTINNDFKGCVFVVRNLSKKCWLFNYKNEGVPLQVDKRLIDIGDFRTIDSLKNGRYLLIIEDKYPWVLKRDGFAYGHQRKDLLLVENGVARNSCIMPYNNDFSNPQCTVVKLQEEPLIIKNITIVRDSECAFLTHIANIAGVDNLKISNVKLYTPASTLTDDRGFSIYNCSNVTFDNIQIDGTYSQLNHSGYGFYLNNVWNFNASRLNCKANWGVFGNNNVNTAKIENSQINRFDVHCYGKDISFKNVNFFDLYNQYSSVYGTIRYERCTFTNFVPVLNGGSYNAYVGHDVVLYDCVLNVTQEKNHICRLGRLNDVINNRHELSEKCWPNLIIKNLTINIKDEVDAFYLYYCKKVKGNDVVPINYLSRIEIDGLTMISEGKRKIRSFYLSNQEIATSNMVECNLDNVQIKQPTTNAKVSTKTKDDAAVFIANIPLKGGKAIQNNVYGLKL